MCPPELPHATNHEPRFTNHHSRFTMTSFYKVSGAGNDFIALIEPDTEPSPDWIREVCRRGVSLGADGVFVLRREGPGRVRMIHYNPDGGRSELCLNGTRCAVQLARELGWGEQQVIQTDSGEVSGRAVDPQTVELTWDWQEPEIDNLTLTISGHASVEVALMDVGVPYAVLDWQQDLATAPVVELGSSIRRHPDAGPRGANVAFVQLTGAGTARVRFFERGVEAETLASGTGVIATAWCKSAGTEPFTVTTVADFQLTAQFADGKATLRGDARVLARGAMFDCKW